VSYGLALLPAARRELNALHVAERLRVSSALDRLAKEPRHPGVRKLTGFRDLYRARVGHLRIVFRIEDAARLVTVAAIGPRRDIYRRL
jgi:mRNA interferase RelE/StbE